MIRVFKSGRHAHRTPLSYRALDPLWEGQITLVDHPDQADLYLFAHSLDLQQADPDIIRDWRQRRRPVVLLSEEPFWDTIWTRQPTARNLLCDTPLGAVPVIQLNHATSTIFDFDRLPYLLLTEHRFHAAYCARFTRNAARSVADWKADFAAAQYDTVFMFERRPEQFHNADWPEANIQGLCAWRTNLAEISNRDVTEVRGHSWGTGPSRFDLPDWHMDKLVHLDGRGRNIGALENTHQTNYISEKLFDAYACGGRPLYLASPGHRVHDLGLPAKSWANFYGMTPKAAAKHLKYWQPDAEFFDAYHGAQQTLFTLFSDIGVLVNERARLGASVIAELQQVLDETD